MVDAGSITAAEAERHPRANVITRAVGAGEAKLDLDKVTGALWPGDRFLLCSDGLCKTLSDHDIEATMDAGGERPVTDTLIEQALARRVNDNVTAVAVAVLE